MKRQLGQYFTRNGDYIVQGLRAPRGLSYIEPFVGEGDLLRFFPSSEVECYDIDPRIECAVKRDVFENPPSFCDKIVITNPPFLARNKNCDKRVYDKYGENDLYKCFLRMIAECLGGILIIPVNFFSSIRSSDVELRRYFIEIFTIERVNVFEEDVFSDTSTAVCSFSFTRRNDDKIAHSIEFVFLPSKKRLYFELDASNNFTIGGELYTLPICSSYKISRYTKHSTFRPSSIVVCCIDNKSKIAAFIADDVEEYCDRTAKCSNRTYCAVVIEPYYEAQEELVSRFNDFLGAERERWHSMFLTTFRESKKSSLRKRISFDLVFRILHYLIDKL